MTGNSTILRLIGIVSVASLVLCIGSAVAFFYNVVTADAFKGLFLAASIVWFVSATVLSERWDRHDSFDDASS